MEREVDRAGGGQRGQGERQGERPGERQGRGQESEPLRWLDLAASDEMRDCSQGTPAAVRGDEGGVL